MTHSGVDAVPNLKDGDTRAFVVIRPVKPYVSIAHQQGTGDIRSHLSAVSSAEELLLAVEKEFHNGSFTVFVELGHNGGSVRNGRTMQLLETEIPFADPHPKRIPVVKEWQRVLSPIEDASERLLDSSLELDQLTIAQPLNEKALKVFYWCFFVCH